MRDGARSRLALALLVGAALVLPACMLGPRYERPPVPAPPAWREIPVAESTTLANTPWWEIFNDPTLTELVKIALQENQDLKIAVERIEESRALYGFTKADIWPKVDATAGASALQLSRDGLPKYPEPLENQKGLFSLGASVSWEIDIFGRIRSATEAQQALMMASEEGRRAVVIALVAAVAQTYIDLRDFDARLAIAQRTIESRREYVGLAKDRFEGGVTPELDYRQAEAEFHRTQSLVYTFSRLVAQTENALSVLLGRAPGAVPRGRTASEMPVPPEVPAGIPSDLLDRRPDLRQAEQFLISSGARIGEAKALLYPRIALTGGIGWESTDIDKVINAPALAWTIAGNLLQPIFNAGKNRRRVEISESQQRQTLYAYERTVLQALREVEDGIVGYRSAGSQRESESARVLAERKVLELAELRYKGGVAAYLEVLDAQRSLFEAELDEAQAIHDHLFSVVTLYKALGGGWTEEAPPENKTASANTGTEESAP